MTPNRPDATCLIALRRRSPFVVGHEAVRLLAALAGVRLRAEPVHRDRERLVRLGADRAERHRAGDEARARSTRPARPRRAASASPPSTISSRPRSVTSARVLVVAQPLELVEPRASRRARTASCSAAIVAGFHLWQLAACGATGTGRRPAARRIAPRGAEAARVARERLVAELVEPDAADPRRRAGEVPLDQRRDRARPPRRSARRDSSARVEMPILDITLSRPSSSAWM